MQFRALVRLAVFVVVGVSLLSSCSVRQETGESHNGVRNSSNKNEADIRRIRVLSLKDPDPGIRRKAATSLSICGDPEIVPALIAAFKDADTAVREEAVRHFVNYPDARAIQPLIEALKDPDPSVRETAVSALWHSKDPRAVLPLIETAQDPKETPDVRASAVFALAISRDARAIDPLLSIVSDRTAPKMARVRAADGLRRFQVSGAIPALMAILQGETEPAKVRAAAAHTLGWMADRDSVDALEQAARTGPDLELRFWAAMSAVRLMDGAVDDPRVVAPIGEYVVIGDGVEDYRWAKQEMLRAVARRGKSGEARSMARTILRNRWGITPPWPNAVVVFIVYLLIAIPVWLYLYREPLSRRQFTLRSLFVLTALLAGGMSVTVCLMP